MKEYYLDSQEREKLFKQLHCDISLDDIVEGCLLDNELYYMDSVLVLVCYEHYLNEWSSDYQIFVAENSEDNEKLLAEWQTRTSDLI